MQMFLTENITENGNIDIEGGASMPKIRFKLANIPI